MKISVGDMTDRYSICMLKYNRILDENSRKTVTKEINVLRDELASYAFEEYYVRLLTVNGQIWDLEADIRQGKEGTLGLEEVGRRAIQIRELNKIRIQIKNEMNAKFHEGFVEIKSDHASS